MEALLSSQEANGYLESLGLFLTDHQRELWQALPAELAVWNAQINVVSRKDMEHAAERHLLHSACLAPFLGPLDGQRVVDIGTGGGFPGLPLAILYPKTHFTLVDSIGKKIKVVQALADALELKNVEAVHARVESLPGGFRTAVTRAVAPMPQLLEWMRNQWAPGAGRRLLALKGGDLREELQGIPHCTVHPLADRIPTEFFSTKSVVEVRVR